MKTVTYAIVENFYVARYTSDPEHHASWLEVLHRDGTWKPDTDIADFMKNGMMVDEAAAVTFAKTYVKAASAFTTKPTDESESAE